MGTSADVVMGMIGPRMGCVLIQIVDLPARMDHQDVVESTGIQSTLLVSEMNIQSQNQY